MFSFRMMAIRENFGGLPFSIVDTNALYRKGTFAEKGTFK
jgi:hypothetical protein